MQSLFKQFVLIFLVVGPITYLFGRLALRHWREGRKAIAAIYAACGALFFVAVLLIEWRIRQ